MLNLMDTLPRDELSLEWTDLHNNLSKSVDTERYSKRQRSTFHILRADDIIKSFTADWISFSIIKVNLRQNFPLWGKSSRRCNIKFIVAGAMLVVFCRASLESCNRFESGTKARRHRSERSTAQWNYYHNSQFVWFRSKERWLHVGERWSERKSRSSMASLSLFTF